jgi:hypothetical protein
MDPEDESSNILNDALSALSDAAAAALPVGHGAEESRMALRDEPERASARGLKTGSVEHEHGAAGSTRLPSTSSSPSAVSGLSTAAALASTAAAAILPGSAHRHHVAPDTSASPYRRSSSSTEYDGIARSTHHTHSTHTPSQHTSPAGSTPVAVGTTASKANGSAASDTAVPAVGASTSASSTTTHGSLKRE